MQDMKKSVVLTIITLFTFSIPTSSNGNEVSLEDKTKAVFIYNFLKYIQWPDDDTAQPFHIAIIGDAEILTPLQEIEKKKTVHNRKIKVTTISAVEEIPACHMLFVSRSEKDNLKKIREAVRGKNILTIGDTEGFAKKGIAINFVIVDEKIRFRINSTVLDDLKLRVSSQLLKLALFVKGKK